MARGGYEMVRCSLEHGPDADATGTTADAQIGQPRATPLGLAIIKADHDIVRLPLEHGVTVP